MYVLDRLSTYLNPSTLLITKERMLDDIYEVAIDMYGREVSPHHTNDPAFDGVPAILGGLSMIRQIGNDYWWMVARAAAEEKSALTARSNVW